MNRRRPNPYKLVSYRPDYFPGGSGMVSHLVLQVYFILCMRNGLKYQREIVCANHRYGYFQGLGKATEKLCQDKKISESPKFHYNIFPLKMYYTNMLHVGIPPSKKS